EEDNLFFADSTFFSILSFPLLSGTPENLLNQPYQVVLSESTARKYFGTENALGRTMKVGTSDNNYIVTGVMVDPPSDTHIKPGILVSFYSLSNSKNETWWNANYATYFLLYPNVDLASLQEKIPGYMRDHSEETGTTGDNYLSFKLEKFRDLHLRSEVPGNFEAAGNIKYIYILAAVGFLILLIACTTYINLTTATGTERSKEIGVQKVMGVSKSHLITQNLMESGVIMGITIVLGFITAKTALPFFNALFDRQLDLGILYTPANLGIIILLVLIVSLLSGIYPAILISRFDPLSALRGYLQSGSRKPQWLKKSLIVFQFVISIILTISALTLYYQMNYIKNKKLGFQKDLVITMPSDRTVLQKYDALKTQLNNLPEVNAVTISYDSPAQIKGGYSVGQDPSGQNERPVTALPAGLDFLKTMNMELAGGQDFNQADLENYEKAGEDSTLISNILINEALSKIWGWQNEEAVGKIVSFNGRRSKIKGVVENFHFASLHEPIEPLVIFPENWGRFILVKLNPGTIQKSLDLIQNVWSSVITHRPFSYHFLDDEFAEMYRFENQNARVTYVFTWLAIFLACLGLFGVASYGFAQRTKEIGIRKVLGSSVSGIFALLAREYIILVLIALLIATPLAWLAMRNWLDQFAYRIDMQWWMFMAAGGLAFLIALFTLSFQGIKAAVMNPIDSLRQE
ncbi:MAG: ABC transporter permease, partial [Saprospiraceae bacterium]|nr:ABC transporter permease [Saprospiraceae bacterium]